MSIVNGKYTELLETLAKKVEGFAVITDKTGRILQAFGANGEAAKHLHGQVLPLAENAYEKEEHLRSFLAKALPMVAKVAGGEAVMFNEHGKRLLTVNIDGTEMNELKGAVSTQAKKAMSMQEPVIGKSFSVNGAMAVRIPITEHLGLGFNNKNAAKQQQKLYEKVKNLQDTKYIFDDIIGESEVFTKTKSMSQYVSNSKSSILLFGETGTGKELFAQSIHNASERREKPFVALNCGALPSTLIESNLFGYEEGAFTGARRGGNPGAFEQANGGTIFLDEISEMEINLQSKLLRVLQEREVVRIGGFKPIKIDVRVIASTNKDLNRLITEGEFRQDLFYRLNVVQINIPPLRERVADIELLVSFLIHKYNDLFGKEITGIDPEALKILQRHCWPGNVRELQNCIEYAINMIEQNESFLMLKHLPIYLRHNPKADDKSVLVELGTNELDLKNALAVAEKNIIQRALEISQYRRVKAAEILGISVPTLWRKMTEHKMTEPNLN